MCIVSVFLILASLIYMAGKDLYQRRISRPGEVIIGTSGVTCSDGEIFAFGVKKARYKFSVRLEEGDMPVLRFESQYYFLPIGDRRSKFDQYGNLVRILVPPHMLDEAHHVLHLSEKHIAHLYSRHPA
jgi:hypothetical protein